MKLTNIQLRKVKEMEKQLVTAMKRTAKELKYKVAGGSPYYQSDGYFNYGQFWVFLDKEPYRIELQICIKYDPYDLLFWRIMDMEDNAKVKGAFRANGAFVAPPLRLPEISYPLEEETNLDELALQIVKDFMEGSQSFLAEVAATFTTFDDYVLSLSGILYEPTLKILAHLNAKQYSQALALAQDEIEKGRCGGFINGILSFNERTVQYCEEQLRLH